MSTEQPTLIEHYADERGNTATLTRENGEWFIEWFAVDPIKRPYGRLDAAQSALDSWRFRRVKA